MTKNNPIQVTIEHWNIQYKTHNVNTYKTIETIVVKMQKGTCKMAIQINTFKFVFLIVGIEWCGGYLNEIDDVKDDICSAKYEHDGDPRSTRPQFSL